MVAGGSATARSGKRKRDDSGVTPPSPKRARTGLTLDRDGAGNVRLRGRPDFNSAARAIVVDRNEDRRHLNHWDEKLKPFAEGIFTKVARRPVQEQITLLQAPLKTRTLRNIPATPDKLMLRIAAEINSATDNLIPGDASINKAIELVRANLRAFSTKVAAADFEVIDRDDAAQTHNAALMASIQAEAERIFEIDNSTDIKSARSRIHNNILKYLRHCDSPTMLWELIHDLTYSVTFDLSSKATRDKTAAMLAWERTMMSSEFRPLDEQLELLLSIID